MYSLHLYNGWNLWEPFPSRCHLFSRPCDICPGRIGRAGVSVSWFAVTFFLLSEINPSTWLAHLENPIVFVNALNGLQMSIVYSIFKLLPLAINNPILLWKTSNQWSATMTASYTVHDGPGLTSISWTWDVWCQTADHRSHFCRS
jgi:hypothetical protein